MVPAKVREGERSQMSRALELARLGRGRVSPNPLVGAVIECEGRVIGEGHHAELGGLHAERAALADCRARGEDPVGATMHVTLEPCAHHGRQPPCVEALVEAGLRRVVIASDDPSEKAAGRGPGILRDAGVEVEWASGEEAAAARLLNQPFRKHSRTGRPLVVLKLAQSLDGRVATAAGDSKWISSEASRALAHEWRADSDAIAVGIGTALADDPLLTARVPDAARQPVRVVFDSSARLPLTAQLLATLDASPVLVICARGADPGRVGALEDAGAEVLLVDGGSRGERLAAALQALGRRQVTSLFLEGGPTLAGSFLDTGEVDDLRLFIAPLVIGDGPVSVSGDGTPALAQAPRALAVASEQVGGDILVRARMREW